MGWILQKGQLQRRFEMVRKYADFRPLSPERRTKAPPTGELSPVLTLVTERGYPAFVPAHASPPDVILRSASDEES